MVRGDKFGRKGKPLIKILFVTSWYPNRVHTQDGNFVREYAEAVGAIHPVTLLHVVEDPAVATVITERHDRTWGKVIQVCYPGARTRVQRIGSRSRAWQVALSEVSAERFDLIHAHVLIDGGIVADSFARRRKIPFVISTHSHRYLEPCPWLRLPELWLARRAARRAAFLLPVSPSLQGGMQGHRIRGNYRVLPN
ncbi:MAG: glycosyltransferase, partial [Bacteroidota bacterium]